MNFKRFGRTANLFDYQTMSGTIKGYYLDSNGNLQESAPAAVTDYIPCNGSKFCLAKVGGISPSICLYDSNKQFIYGQAYNTSGGGDKQTIVVNSVNASYVRFTYFYTGAGIVDDLSVIMLNSGSTALPYQPYKDWHDIPHYIMGTSTDTLTTLPADIYPNDTTATVGMKGQMEQSGTPTPTNPIQPSECGDLETTGEHTGQYKIPILLNSTTINKYLGEVQTVRQIKKYEMTGNETINSATASTSEQGTTLFVYMYGALSMSDVINNGTDMPSIPYPQFLSNSFKMKTERLSSWKDTNSGEVSANDSVRGNNNFIIFGSNQYSTAEDFKAYLQQRYASGNPVTIYYILATPTTAITNEPIRKIGDYADEVSGITIPVTAGENTLSIDTTLQPSEVAAGFSGWHPVSAAHERENGQWD